jgi:phosphoenolpyruvate-protein kinase (PTS system EI component)
MFMIHENFPSENEQYRIYRSLSKLADPNPVVIRALDIGGDKPLKYFDLGKEIDPMLGFRSIRVLLDHPEIFLPHLRAMLRAAQRGNIRILFPMIAHVEDMIAVRAVIDRCLRDLRETYGEKFDMPQIGAMIEMPSAVAQIDAILDYVDFVSLGTNDLVQYTFAVDRGNGRVDRYFKPMHPVILGYLDKVSRACVKRKKGVGVCGEIAGNAQWLPVLAGLGLHHLSMPPPVMPKVKMMAHRIDMDECRKLAQRCLKCRTESEVRQQIERFHEKMNNIEK